MEQIGGSANIIDIGECGAADTADMPLVTWPCSHLVPDTGTSGDQVPGSTQREIWAVTDWLTQTCSKLSQGVVMFSLAHDVD